MTKSEFIAAVAAGANVSKAEADRVIAAAANTLTSRMRDAHPGKNPATGETITIPAKRVAVFKPAKQLKDALN